VLAPDGPAVLLRREAGGGVIERAEADLDVGLVQVEETAAAIGAEGAAVGCLELAATAKGVDRPLAVEGEGAARLLAAVGAVADAGEDRLAIEAVSDLAAEAGTCAGHRDLLFRERNAGKSDEVPGPVEASGRS